MKNQISIIELTLEQVLDIKLNSTHAGWQLLSKSELPRFISPVFAEKTDSFLAITSPTSTGGTYLVCSANRVDSKDMKIDIEPFGLIVNPTGASSWALSVHHGNWDGRSERPPDEIWGAIEHSGIGDYYLTATPSSKHEGTLDELPKGHRGSFDAAIKAIREYADKA